MSRHVDKSWQVYVNKRADPGEHTDRSRHVKTTLEACAHELIDWL